MIQTSLFKALLFEKELKRKRENNGNDENEKMGRKVLCFSAFSVYTT